MQKYSLLISTIKHVRNNMNKKGLLIEGFLQEDPCLPQRRHRPTDLRPHSPPLHQEEGKEAHD